MSPFPGDPLTNAPPTASGEGISAQRIRFRNDLPAGACLLREFKEPCRCVAVAEPLAVADGPAAGSWPEPQDEFCFLFVPEELAATPQGQTRVAEWMARPARAEAVPTVEIATAKDRLWWRPGRALLQGSAQRCDAILAGLVDFAFYEGQLRRLEGEIAADWETAEADIVFTHKVGARDRGQWQRIAEMTERFARRRIRYARLRPWLEKAPLHFPRPARRLIARLREAAGTADRLEALDARLEVCEGLYELANDRLSEFSYFLREYRLEAWIILLLVLEVVIMFADFYVQLLAKD